MKEKHLSLLKLAIYMSNTSPVNQTNFQIFIWLNFLVSLYLHLYKEENKFPCTSLSVS